jgi:putative FmdB family regulatory protein
VEVPKGKRPLTDPLPMPIYEFECLSCSERFDRLQRLNDPDPDSCPNCGATGVRRRLTAPSFRLAGSGWYETDFKKDGDKKRNLAEKPDSAPAEGNPANSKSTEGKSTEGRSGEGRSSEGRSSEGKAGETRTGDAKSGAATAKAEPAGNSTKAKSAEPAKPAASAKAKGKSDAS